MAAQTARIRAGGVTYSASVDRHNGRPRLLAVTMTASDDDDLVTASLLPLSVIAARALAQVEAEPIDGRPSDEQLARAYRDAAGARDARRTGEPTVSIRDEVALRFGAPVGRVDRWLKELRARDPKALPPAFTGRPRETSDAEVPR